MEVLQHDDLVRLTVVLWAIWHARRQVIHENIFQSPLSTHNFVERFLFDLVKVMPKSVNREGGGTRVPRWIPPPNGMMKVNVDAALSKNMNVAAMAVVARDEKGKFQGGSVIVLDGVSSPETAEAMACREGCALASDLGLQKIRIATDCANVVTAIHGPGMGPCGHIVREIKAGMASFLTGEVVHESRKANGDAHTLAKSLIYKQLGRHVWLLAPPDGVCTSYHVT